MSSAFVTSQEFSPDFQHNTPFRGIQPITRGLPPDVEPSTIWYIRPFLGYSADALREYGKVLEVSSDSITAAQYGLFAENLIGACERVTQAEAECWRALDATIQRLTIEIEQVAPMLEAAREAEESMLQATAAKVSEAGFAFDPAASGLDATKHPDLDRAALCAGLNIPVPSEKPSWLWTKGTRLMSATVIGALYGILLGQLLGISEWWQMIPSILVGSTLMLFATVIGLPARHFGFTRTQAGHTDSVRRGKGWGSGAVLAVSFVGFLIIEASVEQYGFLRVLREASSNQSYIQPSGAFLAIALAIAVPTLVATAIGNLFEGVRLSHDNVFAQAYAKRLVEIRTSTAFSAAQQAQVALFAARSGRKQLEARLSQLEGSQPAELPSRDREWIGELERNALGASWELQDRFLKPPLSAGPRSQRPARRTCCCYRLALLLRKFFRRKNQPNPAIHRHQATTQTPTNRNEWLAPDISGKQGHCE